jgi:hypothetical protein
MTAPSRRVQRAAHRLADQQRARIDELPAPQIITTVTAVTPGGAIGGGALVTVRYRGAATVVEGYLASYTPVVGDRVAGVFIDSQLILLGRIAGQPPEQ